MLSSTALMIHLGILINACHWYWLWLNSCWKVQTHMRTHHRSNFIFLILVNPNPINLLKCILRFVLNFNTASSLNRKLMSIITVVITPARVTSGASSVQGSARLSKKSRSRQLLLSLSRSRSRQPHIWSVSKSLSLDNWGFFESRKVSVSTTHAKVSLV